VQKKHSARFFKWKQKMKVSARNQLKGKIAEVTKGATTSHVLIEIGSGVVVTASITNEAVADLQLKKGDDAWAVIKASDVMIGK
jgi:molybdopterin-binding protein